MPITYYDYLCNFISPSVPSKKFRVKLPKAVLEIFVEVSFISPPTLLVAGQPLKPRHGYRVPELCSKLLGTTLLEPVIPKHHAEGSESLLECTSTQMGSHVLWE
jgi:hypothetical protein